VGETLVAGFAVALFVSIPPGMNTALCVTSARQGVRNAVPVILGAAMTDIMYALLAAAGLIVFDPAGIAVAHLLEAGFCLIAAVLMWAYRAAPVPSRTAFGLALLNPGTAVLWLGLSATIVHPHDASSTALWAVGIGAGTTTWFSVLALASSRLHHRLTSRHTLLVQRSFALGLAVTATLLIA
jgi:threonine/homoserine/homoserine lactone efflux protein